MRMPWRQSRRRPSCGGWNRPGGATGTRAGQRLRQLREAAGLNQQELAARSGLTHEEISRLELGHQAPLRGTVRALTRALGVEPAVFVARTKLAPVGLTTAEVARTPGGAAGSGARRG